MMSEAVTLDALSLAHSRALALALALVLALVLTVLSIVTIVVAIAATLGASVRASDNCTTTSATPITISSTTSKSAMSRRMPQPLPQPSQVSTAVIAGEIAVLAGVSCPMDQRGHRAWFALCSSLNGSRFAALPSKINSTPSGVDALRALRYPGTTTRVYLLSSQRIFQNQPTRHRCCSLRGQHPCWGLAADPWG